MIKTEKTAVQVSNYGSISRDMSDQKTHGLGTFVRTVIRFRKNADVQKNEHNVDDDGVDDDILGSVRLDEESNKRTVPILANSMASVPLVGEYSNTNRYIRNATTRLQRSYRSIHQIDDDTTQDRHEHQQGQEFPSIKASTNSMARAVDTETLQRRLDEIYVLELMKNG
jgi:hypothetical protein